MGKTIYHKFGRLPTWYQTQQTIVGNNQNNNPSQNRVGNFGDY
jgi:hypothetical protein